MFRHRSLAVCLAACLTIGAACDSNPSGGTSSEGAGAGASTTPAATSGAGASGSGTTGAGAGVGVACEEAEAHSGEATYYDFADGSGNCSFPATPNDLMVAAMNQTDYAGSYACGACIRVNGPNGSVDVRVVDRCPGCPAGDVDLSPDAFSQIADLSAGRVPVDWTYVACPTTSPVVFHFKDGSNAFWSAVQVRNHRHAIAELAYQNGDGEWVDVERLEYNYFVAPEGMGEGPYTFRIRDVMGSELVESGIGFVENGEVPGSAQFPPCD